MRKPKSPKLPPELKELYQLARKARLRAHSPYSSCKVGAALRTSKGSIYSGCNVENSSYGGTICAERSAICNAISHEGATTLQDIVVVTDASPPWPPCGMCRQAIAEFVSSKTRIIAINLEGEVLSWTFDELLPAAFSPLHLKAK